MRAIAQGKSKHTANTGSMYRRDTLNTADNSVYTTLNLRVLKKALLSAESFQRHQLPSVISSRHTYFLQRSSDHHGQQPESP